MIDHPARSAISDNGRDSQYVPEKSRNGPDLDWHRDSFFFFFRKKPNGPEGSNLQEGGYNQPNAASYHLPLLSRWPPVVLAGSGWEQSKAHPRNLPSLLSVWSLPPPRGQEEVRTTQILAPAPTQSGGPGASGGRRAPPQPAPLYPAPPTSGPPPASALCSSFPPSSLPSLPLSLSSGAARTATKGECCRPAHQGNGAGAAPFFPPLLLPLPPRQGLGESQRRSTRGSSSGQKPSPTDSDSSPHS